MDHAIATLNASINTSQTSLTVNSSTDAVKFPATNFYIAIDNELINVATTGSSPYTTWTITRAQYGTTAATHTQGTKIYNAARSGAFLNLGQILSSLAR